MALPPELEPLHLVVTEVTGENPDGASRPLYASARDENGTEYRIVLKLRDPQVADGRPWAKCSARDLIGSILARALGLQVPNYGVATVSPHLVRALSRTPWGNRLAQSVGPNFASVFLEGAIDASLARVSREQWANLINFDALVWNADRRGGNSNALVANGVLHLIDHGMIVPSWTFGPFPVTPSSVWTAVEVRLHLAQQYLRADVPTFDLGNRWCRVIDRSLLAEIAAVVPPEWSDDGDRREWLPFLAGRCAVTDLTASELTRLIP